MPEPPFHGAVPREGRHIAPGDANLVGDRLSLPLAGRIVPLEVEFEYGGAILGSTRSVLLLHYCSATVRTERASSRP